ncbi:RluA family pseudouridine synthase [Acholeplasma hippikon]|uniref:Pseudouridine synthase n=1 Tax=Acholeplasma hippikon TaxID=264636 RepID=A0A449BIU9_9MOLU|nr:RluA family pseudouridine synthase [Acholeplasma hippikon]VEU82333.1 ribosomal large subunit pseudouridine synthase D [Acholeplasma hippikon]
MNMIKFNPSIEFVGKTIREYLQSLFVGKAVIYKYSSNKWIFVNDKNVNSEYRLKEDDQIEILLEEKDTTYFTNEPITIIYEDDDIVLVEKPIDLLVHTDGNEYDTLTDRVGNYYQEKGYKHPVLPAHRIDKDTSGMVLFAKHFVALAYFSNLFENNSIHKIYRCIVEGRMENKEGKIASKLLFDNKQNKMVISKYGKEAESKYVVVRNLLDETVLDVSIKSGRTHQIRVHLASIGHPVVGDKIYGHEKIRLMLHFRKIGFKHFRDGKMLFFESKSDF